MTYKLFCQDSVTSVVHDVTDLSDNISYQTFLSGQPGKLNFTLHEDSSGILKIIDISRGSIITFIVDGEGVFYGYLFTTSVNESGSFNMTAYDQMRYLKFKDVFITSGMTASQIFERVCKNSFPALREEGKKTLNYQIVTPSQYIVPEYFHDNKSLYQIIEYGIIRTNIYENKQYFIKDKYGILQFTELNQEKTNLIIGDESLLTDYSYEISIDKETYNQIKVTRNNKKTNKVDSWVVFSSETQAKWGKLQLVEKANDSMNESQIREFAENNLIRYNRESQTFKLNALGSKEIIAGSGFRLELKSLGINRNVWVTSATHNFKENLHTMSLDVYI